MNVTEYFSLSVKNGHVNIDFIDIDLHGDTKLFLDPSLIEGSNDCWCRECAIIIDNFFCNVFECLKHKDESRLYEILNFGREPNETRLGLSQNGPNGKGTSAEVLIEIFKKILRKDLLSTELVKSPMDLCVFVHDFAEDRMSDLITNVLRKKLNEFTIKQCNIHGIELTDEVINIGKAWNHYIQEWEDVIDCALQVDDSVILLVPKNIVRRTYIYSVSEYLSKKIIEHRQDYHVQNNTELAQLKYSKKRGEYIAPPTKATVREKDIGDTPSKDYAIEYTLEHPELIDEFRDDIKRRIKYGEYTLRNEELDEIVY